MPDVYQYDKAKNNELKPKQWVRIKNGGIYNGDIGLVERVQESKVHVRLIPRIDFSGLTAAEKGNRRFAKPLQRINF